jgi:hypothetical protein
VAFEAEKINEVVIDVSIVFNDQEFHTHTFLAAMAEHY